MTSGTKLSGSSGHRAQPFPLAQVVDAHLDAHLHLPGVRQKYPPQSAPECEKKNPSQSATNPSPNPCPCSPPNPLPQTTPAARWSGTARLHGGVATRQRGGSAARRSGGPSRGGREGAASRRGDVVSRRPDARATSRRQAVSDATTTTGVHGGDWRAAMAAMGGRPGRWADGHGSCGHHRPRVCDRAYIGSQSPLSLSLSSFSP
jgi:hypothetical protein